MISEFSRQSIEILDQSILFAAILPSWSILPLLCLLVLLGVAILILTQRIRKINTRVRHLEREKTDLKNQIVHSDGHMLELKNSYELKMQLYEGLSHQILSQAALVSGPIENLIQADEIHIPEIIKTHLNQTQDSADTLFKLLHQLSDLIEFNKGEHRLKLESFGVHHFMSRLYSAFESQGMSREIEMSFACNLNSDLNLMIDSVRLETIVNALMMHILYCTPNGGVIKFSVKGSEEGTGQFKVNVSIEYTRDERMKPGDQQEPHGTDFGLGLILAQNFAEIIGADIKESQLAASNRVAFQFHAGTTHEPASEELEHRDDVKSTPDHNHNPEARILVVEDYLQMRKYIKRLLQSKYKVYEARNGHEAIKVLEKRQIDLVISDLMMPGMTGIELQAAMKEHDTWCDIAFIMLTARNDKLSKLNALDMGLEDYVTKPFQSQELLARVRNGLRRTSSKNTVKQEIVENPTYKDELIARITSQIEQQLHDASFCVDVLVDDVGLSKRSLYRKVKEETGYTPANYIKELRLTRSQGLLKAQKFGTIAEVSYAVGYNSTRVFSDHYFERFAKRPSEYL